MRTRQELLAAHATIREFGGTHFHDGVSADDARRAKAYLNKIAAEDEDEAHCNAVLDRRLPSIEASKRAREEQAQREREDPLTMLTPSLQPTADDDSVFVGIDIPLGEFRREDGRRYQFKKPGIVMCIPAADATEEQRAKATGVGSEFNDVLALVARQRRRVREEWRVRTNSPFANPPDEYPPIEHAKAMIVDESEPMLLVYARWGEYALANPSEGRGALAETIRKHLDRCGRLSLMRGA